jgi:two-component system sensor histidine kinase UhpB
VAVDHIYTATLKRGLPARAVLAAAIIGVLLPTFVVAGWLASRTADSEREQVEQNVQQRAHEISAILDREVIGIESTLAALGTSSSLHNGNLAGFHAKAQEISQQLGLQLGLYDFRQNKQILNTSAPYGAELPAFSFSPQVRDQIMGSKIAFVSGLLTSPINHDYRVAIIAPIRPAENLPYLLGAAFPVEKIAAVFGIVQLQPAYVVSVVDRDGRILARSANHEELVGRTVPPRFLTLAPESHGNLQGPNVEGIDFRWFYQKSTVTGWTVMVGAPTEIFDSSFRFAARLLAGAAVALFAVGLTIAYRIGGKFSRAVSELGSVARDLPHQAPPRSVTTSLRETNRLLDDLKAASNDLRFAGAQQRFAIDAAGIGTWSWNIVENRLTWSARTREIYRLPPDAEPTIEHFLNVVHPDDRDMLRANMRACFQGLNSYEIEFRALAEDGEAYRWLNGKGRVERDATGAAITMQGAVQDITERKQSEAERDDLRRQLMRAQEQERLRLAHELHDQTGQSLTAAMLEVKQIEPMVGHNGLPHLDRLRGQLEEIGTTVHRIAHELRPTAIEDLGLSAALANHLTEWSQQYGIQSDFHFQCSCTDVSIETLLSDEAKTAIYRIGQEALTNVAKHARDASAVGMILNCNNSLLQLTIEDNGRGFETATLRGRTGASGLGLAGMRERAALIGGKLEIESSPDAGTTIFLRVPVESRRRVA